MISQPVLSSNAREPRGFLLHAVALLAIVFGLATLRAGGQVLFGAEAARSAAGQYVGFVLWFNFVAGFLYIVAGAGLWMRRSWARWLAAGIAAATLLVFAAFGVHVVGGGGWEPRTAAAMTLRSLVWIAIAWFAWRRIPRRA